MGKRQAAKKSGQSGNALAQRAMIAATHPGGWIKASVGPDPESVVSQPWNSMTLTFSREGSNATAWIRGEELGQEVFAQTGYAARSADYNLVLKVKHVAAWCTDSLMITFRQLATTNALTIAGVPSLTIEDHPGRLAFARVAAQMPAAVAVSAAGNVQVFGYKTASTAAVYFKVRVQYRMQKDADAPVDVGFERRSRLSKFGADNNPPSGAV